MDQSIIQQYVNNLRRHLTSLLKPNIGLEVDIYNCGDEGAVLIIYFKPGGKSIDKEIRHFDTIGQALDSIQQNFFGGDLSGIHFKGTNMMMDQNQILIIKENAEEEWTVVKLKEDLSKVIQPPTKSKR